MRGNVIEWSQRGTKCDIVSLSALSRIIWVYFFRNRARLAKLAVNIEPWSIGTAVDRLAVMIYLIQVALPHTLLTPSTCPIVKLQSSKDTSLTNNGVIDHLFLPQALFTYPRDNVEELIDIATGAVLGPEVEHVVLRAVEANLFFEPNKGSIEGTIGQIVSCTSFEHEYLVVTLRYRSIEPIISCQVILLITFADIHNTHCFLTQILGTVVTIKRTIDNRKVISCQIDHLFNIWDDELTINAL